MLISTRLRPVRSRPVHRPARRRGAGSVGAVCALVIFGLAGCGGSDEVAMPDVSTRRLDIALSDIKGAGFEDEVEVVGGGTFGVVDESNWTVCDQEPSAGTTVGSAPRLTVARTCGDEDSLEGSAEEESEAPQDSGTTTPNKKTDSNAEAENAPATETFLMPTFVGANLQDAQDLLQSLGSYLLTQTDATGLGRFQVLDSGWKVCGQRPRAGASVPVDQMVELLAVKLSERCS